MNIKTYTYLLSNPQAITQEQLTQIAPILKKYPYFQSAHALQLKGLKNHNSFLYNDALKTTAAHTTDRNILFEYITSKSFSQHEIAKLISKHDESVLQLDVEHDDLSASISVEIDNQLKAELDKATAILNPDLFLRKKESVEEIASITSEKNNSEEEVLLEEKKSDVIAEKHIEANAPLDFKKEDTHSFVEWLKLSAASPIKREAEKTEDVSEKKEEKSITSKFDLIEKFIQDTPKLKPEATQGKNINLAKQYSITPEALMTETLAKVYVQQKNYKKAIQAYKILILKNPEKSGFFADQIRAVEKLINKE